MNIEINNRELSTIIFDLQASFDRMKELKKLEDSRFDSVVSMARTRAMHQTHQLLTKLEETRLAEKSAPMVGCFCASNENHGGVCNGYDCDCH